MKTRFLMLGLMMTALNLTNCTKDDADNGLGTAENVITHTVVVDNEPWDGNARSIYEPGVGIHRDGTETISVYYSVATDDGTYKFPTSPAVGSPAEDGSYTFTHAIADGATAYDYYFMMPHLATSRANSKGDASYHRLGPVQLPAADSFDPSYDFLVGKPAKNVSATDQAVVVTQFKRITTPVRLKLSDGAGILAGQKIQQVTIAFDDTTNKGINKCLSGLFYFKYSEDVDQNNMSGWETNSISNTATADYPTGLEQNGNWETWLMVNPTTLNPSSMTITVVSDKMRITRTIPTTGKTFEFRKDAINSIGIDVTGTGYQAEDAYSIGFTQYSKIQSAFPATDGVDYNWTFTNCTYTRQNYIGNALRLPNANSSGSITLPAVSDISYKTLYITENANNTSKTTPLSIMSGETEVVTIDCNYYGPIAQQGGVLAIDIPAEYAQGPLTLKHTGAENLWINRMTVVYGEPQEGPGPGPEPDEDTDYYTTYTKGGDIKIGDLVINKTNYPDAKLVNISAFKNNVFTDGGVVFVEGEGSFTMTTSPSIHTGLILIGNDPEKQPTIVCKGTTSAYYFAVRGEDCDYVFKNLNIDGSSNNYIFSNTDNANATGKIKSLTLEDCSIVTSGNVIQDGNSNNSMQNVTVRNCVIRMSDTATGKAIYGWATGKTDKATDQLATVTLTDNVIYASAPVSNYLVMIGGKATNVAYDTNAAIIVVESNSTYNIYHGNGFVSAYSAADIRVNYNVSAFDNSTLNKNSYSIGYSKADDPKNFTVTNNYCYTNNGTTQKWKAIWKNTNATATTTTKNNSFTLQEIPFASTNIETGYFPIDKSVVTNGAGASYETKLWNKWE